MYSSCVACMIMYVWIAVVMIVLNFILIKAIPLISNDIKEFGWRLLYDISFFIIVTTIGLNIIFGIIVDTFSELRDERVGTNAKKNDYFSHHV